MVIVQNKKRIEKELQSADILFTHFAAFVGSSPPIQIKNLAIRRKKGAPGGWPTSNLCEHAIYSPQSQKLAVPSIVEK